MTCTPTSPFLQRLAERLTLQKVPFSDAGSRLLVFRHNSHFSIRLAERWSKWQDEVGHYRRRPPMIDDWMLCDENGAPVDFQLTTYPHAICFETRLGQLWIAFEDEETLYLELPPARIGISFRVYAMHGRTDRRGGEFKGDPEHRSTHRNVAYTTNARIISNTIQDAENGYLRVQLQLQADEDSAFQLNITPRLGFNRSIRPAEMVMSAAERRWHDWFARVPAVEEQYALQYYYAWWILRAGLLSPRFFLTHEAMMPSMVHYVGIWHWDAFFHALAYQHIDQKLAEDQLRIVLDHQREDGMIPDAVYDEGIITEIELPHSTQKVEVTKPPLIAWAALKLYETSGHRDFLQEIYEPIVRWNRWWFDKNDDDHDGVVQYNHPFSSGLDDNPLWDQGMPVESPDLNTYLVIQLDALAKIAEILGLEADAVEWRREADLRTRRMISHFWDEHAGVFWATRNHEPVRVLTPFNLYPLLTGRLPRGMADRLLAHLLSPDEFWTEYPIPSVARNDPQFNPNQMWRGPTWVNINYLFIEGLVRSGYHQVARTLRDKTLELVMRHNDIYEYYNPETGNAPTGAAPVYGWSSAIFVDLAIQASQGKLLE